MTIRNRKLWLGQLRLGEVQMKTIRISIQVSTKEIYGVDLGRLRDFQQLGQLVVTLINHINTISIITIIKTPYLTKKIVFYHLRSR